MYKDLKDWVVNKSRSKDYLMYTDVVKFLQDIIIMSQNNTHKTNMAFHRIYSL